MMRNLGLDNVTSFGCSIGPGGLPTAATGKFFWSELRELKKQTSKSEGLRRKASPSGLTESKDTDSGTRTGVGVSSNSSFPNFMFSQAGSDLFDFSLLPEFDAVRKYFGLSAFYILSRQDGFFFEFKYLNPHLDN